MKKDSRIGEYHLGRDIGQGSFSKVRLATHLPSLEKVAVKIIDKVLLREMLIKQEQQEKDKLRQKLLKQARQRKQEELIRQLTISSTNGMQEIFNSALSEDSPPNIEISVKQNAPVLDLQPEVLLLMNLDHPNIVKIFQVIDSDDECYIVLQYAPQDMTKYIGRYQKLTELESRKFFRQLVSAIEHAHKASIVHRDLKLENLLLDAENNLILSDFGLGRKYLDSDPLSETFCGTPSYAAVEVVSGIPYKGEKVDIWGMGVLLFIFVAGQTPFGGRSIPELYKNIKNLTFKIPEHFSEDLADLVKRIFVKDPADRIDIEGIRMHPWVNKDEIERPLQVSPVILQQRDISSLIKTIYVNEQQLKIYKIRAHESGSKRQRRLTAGPCVLSDQAERLRSQSSKPGNDDQPQGAEKPKITRRISLKRFVTLKKGQTELLDYNSSNSPDYNTHNTNSLDRFVTRKLSLGEHRLDEEPSESPEFMDEQVRQAQETPTESSPNPPIALDEWHLFNKPPKTIRSKRFDLERKTCSSNISPSVMFQELYQVLLKIREQRALRFCRVSDYYMVVLNIEDNNPELKCSMEIELCKVYLLNMHSLRFRRVTGNDITYEEVKQSIGGMLRWG